MMAVGPSAAAAAAAAATNTFFLMSINHSVINQSNTMPQHRADIICLPTQFDNFT